MVFSNIFGRDMNFPVYLLSGQLIFGFFNESTTQAMRSVVGGAGIIRKIFVPKYIFPVSRVLSSMVNMFFSFLAFLLVFIVTRAPVHWNMLLIPIPILYTFVFSLGVGMLLSSLAVFFHDITYLYGVFTVLLMYLTPIFYPVSLLPRLVEQFIGLNPLYHYVDYFRKLVMHGVVPGLWPNMVCIGFALAALSVGIYVSVSQQGKYILYL
jgi:ABC-type polysaccharide/polyol phosphate export permease